ncbi:MAG: DUF2325 domain-containing protein [Firmicutes bacterium]|nr:DUF2325 domain-containing protein [Bacillota bacterium]
MTVLIVGGDRLGNIPDVLYSNGFNEYIHWTGRKKGIRNKKIPSNTDVIIILYDYIGHNLTNIVRKQSKSMDIPCIFSKRSCSDLLCKLDRCVLCNKKCKNKL